MSNIKITKEKRVYDEYLKIEEATINEIDKKGKEYNYTRYALNRPDAVAVLIYNSDKDAVILVKQHRYPTQVHGGVDGDIFEIVAGKIDEGEEPIDAAIREVNEEVGYEVESNKMLFMSKYFPSPGYSSEIIYLYCVVVTNNNKTSEGGGVDYEYENIIIHNIPVIDFFKMISNGDIVDGKTIMGANAFWHLRNDNFVQLGMQYAKLIKTQEDEK